MSWNPSQLPSSHLMSKVQGQADNPAGVYEAEQEALTEQEVITSEVTLDVEEVLQFASKDLDFFASLLMPEVVTSPFPRFYKQLWQLLIEVKTSQDATKVFRFALGLPRNHAKTTFVKLLLTYFILYKVWHFPLIVCANESLAENALADIHAMLCSEVVTQLWGDWKGGLTKNTNALKRGHFLGRDVILAARGAGSSLRGMNLANRRPDVILMDDMQTRECAMSEAERNSLLQWMFATLLKARDQTNAIMIFIGNMYNEECILNKLRNHTQWTSLITGAILEDHTALWSELFTVGQLVSEYEHDSAVGLGEIWYAEVMNLVVGGAGSLLPSSTLPVYDYEDDEPISRFLTADPAGFRSNADENVLVVHEVHPDNTIVVKDIVSGIWNPGEMVDNMMKLVEKYDLQTVGIETTSYQQALKWLFERELELLGLSAQLNVVELNPSRRNKTIRILTHVKELFEGTYFIHSSMQAKYLYQALAFRTDRTNNKDDILDCCAYGLDIRNNNHIIPYSNLGLVEQLNQPKVYEANSFLD